LLENRRLGWDLADLAHWRAGGASEQLADFLVGERALALIVRRGGFWYPSRHDQSLIRSATV
jgi:hypothetical protein